MSFELGINNEELNAIERKFKEALDKYDVVYYAPAGNDMVERVSVMTLAT